LVSTEDARLLRLAEVEREPAAAIATELGISTGNVYTRLHRARAHLRDSWIAAHRTQENDHA
jgi:DNA-directed RNA polymerase specialized sigma24 family protein